MRAWRKEGVKYDAILIAMSDVLVANGWVAVRVDVRLQGEVGEPE